jgi:hypothetical protein
MMAVWGVVNQMPARRDASGPGGKPTWPMTWDDLVYTIVDTALESVTDRRRSPLLYDARAGDADPRTLSIARDGHPWRG